MTYVHGIFNVAKCVTYLRSVGVEISAEQEQEWLDAEKTERFFRKVQRPYREGIDWWCQNGHQEYVERKRGQRRKKMETRCATCGARMAIMKMRWTESGDGQIRDYRPKDERFRALDWQPPPVGQDPPPSLLG